MLTANEAWIKSISEVSRVGEFQSPRGIPTTEIVNQTICFDMNYPVCYHQNRKLSYVFMAAEAYWITSGSMFVEDIAPYNKHIANFSDDDYIFNGAYGPKFINQVQYVVNTLLKDPTSRQAIMTIWVPNPIKTKDYPCTVSLQFLIRDKKIHTVVNMRSNDLWLGRPYDIFNFTVMTLRVLSEINSVRVIDEDIDSIIDLGTMHLNTGSSHIYHKDAVGCAMVLSEIPDLETGKVPDTAKLSWNYVARSLLACRDGIEDSNLWKIRP
jgi:thymidylate synthase